jgi:hypothetical protein
MIVNNSFGLCNFLLCTAHTFHRAVFLILSAPLVRLRAGDIQLTYIHSAARAVISDKTLKFVIYRGKSALVAAAPRACNILAEPDCMREYYLCEGR